MLKGNLPGIKQKYVPVPRGSVRNRFHSDSNRLIYSLSARNPINKSYAGNLTDSVSHTMAKKR